MASRDPRVIERFEREDLPSVAMAFGVGSIQDVMFLPSGLMNLNWRVAGSAGVVAIKRLMDVEPRQAMRSLELLGFLADAGVAVAAPLSTEGEDLLVTAGDGVYCASPWVEGQQLAGDELTVAEASQLGAVLGRIHVALEAAAIKAGFEWPDGDAVAKVADPAAADRAAARFLDVIVARSDPDSFDLAAAETLHRRRALLQQHWGEGPVTNRPLGPAGWTHGDFQPLNLLWRDGAVAAVLDWDRVAVRPLGSEVVRSANYLFPTPDGQALDLERIAAFVSGYRSEMPGLTRAAGDDAVDRMWWKRLTDLWHLEFRYDRGDTSCDHLYASSCHVLEWWTDRRELVREAFAAGASS